MDEDEVEDGVEVEEARAAEDFRSADMNYEDLSNRWCCGPQLLAILMINRSRQLALLVCCGPACMLAMDLPWFGGGHRE